MAVFEDVLEGDHAVELIERNMWFGTGKKRSMGREFVVFWFTRGDRNLSQVIHDIEGQAGYKVAITPRKNGSRLTGLTVC